VVVYFGVLNRHLALKIDNNLQKASPKPSKSKVDPRDQLNSAYFDFAHDIL
jgi:hypothetical protein